MRTPWWLTKIPSRTRTASAGLALVAVCTLASGALASPLLHFPQLPRGHLFHGLNLPGMSLGELLEGDGFESGNGKLLFTDFEAEIEGRALRNLDFYRVIPTGQGFKLFTPLLALFGSQAELTLAYKVATTEEELIIESASISFLGFALGNASTWVEASLFDASGDPVGKLTALHKRLFSRGRARDRLELEDPLAEIDVAEIIGVRSGRRHCLGGIARAVMVDHRFKVAVIPEPATALLLAMGLVGLAVRQRQSNR